MENVRAAREEEKGTAQRDVADEEHDGDGGRIAGAAEQFAGVEKNEVGGDEGGDEVGDHVAAAEFTEGKAEEHEREAEERGRGAEIAVDFSSEDEGFATDGLVGYVEVAVEEARHLVIVKRGEFFRLEKTKGAVRDHPCEQHGAEGGDADEPTVVGKRMPRGLSAGAEGVGVKRGEGQPAEYNGGAKEENGENVAAVGEPAGQAFAVGEELGGVAAKFAAVESEEAA